MTQIMKNQKAGPRWECRMIRTKILNTGRGHHHLLVLLRRNPEFVAYELTHGWPLEFLKAVLFGCRAAGGPIPVSSCFVPVFDPAHPTLSARMGPQIPAVILHWQRGAGYAYADAFIRRNENGLVKFRLDLRTGTNDKTEAPPVDWQRTRDIAADISTSVK